VFWDTGILLPFTDQVTIGGDVLVMGGAVNFIGTSPYKYPSHTYTPLRGD
jgi:hypothetical protein